MRASGWAVCAAVCALAWGFEVEARSFRSGQYPNGNGCNDCHQAYPGDPNLTSFGRQVWDNLAGANVDWPVLVDLDADGDGFSNGEELGDADAVYPSGALQQRKSDPFDVGSVPVPIGNPPTAQAISASGQEDAPLQGTLSGEANDPNDVRYFRVVTPPERGELVELNRRTGAFRYMPEPNDFGAVSFEYRLFDGQQLSPVVVASLTIAPVNDLPMISGPTERQVLQGEPLSFAVSAEDVEDGPLAVMNPTPLPQGASFNAGSFAWTPTEAQVGEHELRFVARDQAGAEAALVVRVYVAPNNEAPVLGALAVEGEAVEGGAVLLRAPATDEDGDALTWTWDLGDGSPPQMTQEGTLQHTYAQDGDYAVSVAVFDGFEEDEDALTVEVVNAPPVPEAGADLSGVVGQALSFAGSFTDPGAQDAHTVLWDFGDGTQDAQSGLMASHAYAQPGVYTVTLAVSDEEARARDTLTVTITAGDDPGNNANPANNANNANTGNNASANNANNANTNNASAGNNAGNNNSGDGGEDAPAVGDGGCQSAPSKGLGGAWLLAAALGLGWLRRRRG